MFFCTIIAAKMNDDVLKKEDLIMSKKKTHIQNVLDTLITNLDFLLLKI